jgi:hypothetical protein
MISSPERTQRAGERRPREMYGTQNLRFVLDKQDQLRRESANTRLVARIHKQEPRKSDARRVLGLRLSLA